MKTVLITGASRGIGAETARLFSTEGYNVAINYNKSEAEALNLAKQLKNAIAVKANIANPAQCKKAVEDVINTFGGIDVLINNAGIALPQMLFTDTTDEDFDGIYETNVRGMCNMTRFVTPHMVKKHCGNIVNIASIWGIRGASCEVLYSASKAAVTGFTKSLASELGPAGIRVNCVAPGYIDTDMNAHIPTEDKANFAEQTPLCRIGKAEEVANAILFLASEKASFITGQILCVDGGYSI